MSTGGHALIRYRVRPQAVEEHLHLLAAIFDELEQRRPPGFRYESFGLEDGVTFVDVVAGHQPGLLSELTTWAPYRSTLAARCDQPPVLETLTATFTYP
jgi:hypothetical protein